MRHLLTSLLVFSTAASSFATMGCSSAQRTASLQCDDAAAVAMAPQIEDAVQNKDKSKLAMLAIELGGDAFVCALKAWSQATPAQLHQVSGAGSGSGSGSGR